MGMNHAGEIRRLAEIARPDIGVVTNVGYAHVEFFDSIEGIAAAKRELIEGLPPDGVAVLNADDARVARFAEVHPGRSITFGFSEGAGVRAENVEYGAAGSRFRALGVDFESPLSGRHAVMNLLAAIAVAHAFEIPAERLRPAVASFTVGAYLSQSITEFWRRWHISLSTWLRDYLYVPLGGNREGPRAHLRQPVARMLLGGLWHGAAWNFVIWGALHGALLAVERLRRTRRRPTGRLPAPMRVGIDVRAVSWSPGSSFARRMSTHAFAISATCWRSVKPQEGAGLLAGIVLQAVLPRHVRAGRGDRVERAADVGLDANPDAAEGGRDHGGLRLVAWRVMATQVVQPVHLFHLLMTKPISHFQRGATDAKWSRSSRSSTRSSRRWSCVC